MRTRYILLLLSILFALPARAHQTEFPVAIGEECVFPSHWYAAQVLAWRTEVLADADNADAWLNYYMAERFRLIASGKSPESERLDSIVTVMKGKAGNSFEYHYITYLNNQGGVESYKHLQAAYRADPTRKEVYDDYMLHYEKTRNESGKAEFASKWLHAGAFAPEIHEYCSNLLSGTGSNAVIISSGYADTYSLWLYQRKSGDYSRHVTSIELLKDPDYRSWFLEKAGWNNPYPGIKQYDSHALLLQLATVNQGKELHLTLHHEQKILQRLAPRLFLAGLTFQLTAYGLPDAGMVDENWNAYRLQEFNRVCNQAPGNTHEMMSGYIMPLMVIYRQYETEGKQRRASEYLGMAESIARATRRDESLSKVMQRRE